jgi:hypothetical protein
VRFDVVRTGGGLHIKRELYRVTLRGFGSVYVGVRVRDMFAGAVGREDLPWGARLDFALPVRNGWYISDMPYETVFSVATQTRKEAVAKAKQLLSARDAAHRLGGPDAITITWE